MLERYNQEDMLLYNDSGNFYCLHKICYKLSSSTLPGKQYSCKTHYCKTYTCKTYTCKTYTSTIPLVQYSTTPILQQYLYSNTPILKYSNA